MFSSVGTGNDGDRELRSRAIDAIATREFDARGRLKLAREGR
jgi:hypothetical protein